MNPPPVPVKRSRAMEVRDYTIEEFVRCGLLNLFPQASRMLVDAVVLQVMVSYRHRDDQDIREQFTIVNDPNVREALEELRDASWTARLWSYKLADFEHLLAALPYLVVTNFLRNQRWHARIRMDEERNIKLGILYNARERELDGQILQTCERGLSLEGTYNPEMLDLGGRIKQLVRERYGVREGDSDSSGPLTIH